MQRFTIVPKTGKNLIFVRENRVFTRDCKCPRNSVPLVTTHSDSAQYRKNLQDVIKAFKEVLFLVGKR